jgi:hypothetical protein
VVTVTKLKATQSPAGQRLEQLVRKIARQAVRSAARLADSSDRGAYLIEYFTRILRPEPLDSAFLNREQGRQVLA